jgi:hypothetical protein
MKEVLIHSDSCTPHELMTALAPLVEGSAALELRSRFPRTRSADIDPNVLVGIIQAGATVLTTFIAGLIGYYSRPHDGASTPAHPIRIIGDGIIVELPTDAGPDRLAAAAELVRRSEHPRIYLP